jgi:hypothetical protein
MRQRRMRVISQRQAVSRSGLGVRVNPGLELGDLELRDGSAL